MQLAKRYLGVILFLFGLACSAQQVMLMPPPVSSSSITNVTRCLTNQWKFDENTGLTANDSKDSATGTLTASGGHANPAWTPGKFNSALLFDGLGSFVQLSTNTGVGNGAFTVSLWVSNTVSQSETYVYDSDNDSSAGFFVYSTSLTSLTLQVPASSTDLKLVGTAALPLNQWVHLAFVYGGTITSAATCHIYTNGVELSYTTTQNGSGTHNANGGSSRAIGTPGTGSAGFFAGAMDEVLVYNCALNATEISYLADSAGRGNPP